MTYEDSKTIKPSKGAGKRAAIKDAELLSTGRLLWIITKRHKTAMLVTWAVVMTVLYAVPSLPYIVLSYL